MNKGMVKLSVWPTDRQKLKEIAARRGETMADCFGLLVRSATRPRPGLTVDDIAATRAAFDKRIQEFEAAEDVTAADYNVIINPQI
jgi:hypothetical protein